MNIFRKSNSLYQCWVFSLYVNANIKNGNISKNIFGEELVINEIDKEGGRKVATINKPPRPPDVDGMAHNMQNVASQACFLEFDNALDGIFGQKNGDFPKHYLDMPEGTLRLIIYMMRCAFAHNPASPVWEIRGDYKKLGVVKLPAAQFEIDFTGLDGKSVHGNQHGGLKPLIGLINYCLTVIENNTK